MTSIQNTHSQCKKALQGLKESLAALKSEQSSLKKSLMMDASIKRFEVLFEYVWKLLKLATEYEGLESPGPRPAIRSAFRLGWISQDKLWAQALSARNNSVHNYFGISQEDYLQLMEDFCQDLARVLKKIPKT